MPDIDADRLEGNPYAIPDKAFEQFDLGIDSTGTTGAADTQDIDNIFARRIAFGIYEFAQSKSSMLLPMIEASAKVSFSGGLLQYYRRGQMDFTAKRVASPNTPHAEMQYDKRVALRTLLHQGILLDPDFDRSTDIDLGSNFQAEISNALGRNMDKLFQFACTQDAITLKEASALGFQGAVTTTATALPDTQRLVRTTGQSTPAIATIDDDTSNNNYAGIRFFDYLTLVANEKNLSPSSLMIIGGPQLRFQLKRTKEFRDRDNNVSFKDYENGSVVKWLDFTFVVLNQDCYFNDKKKFDGKRYNKDGAIVPSGGTLLANDLSNVKVQTLLMVDRGAVIHGTDMGATMMRRAEVESRGHSVQHYLKYGVAFGRRDENKVWQILYKEA